MGEAEKAKKKARDKKELDAINGDNTNTDEPKVKGAKDPDILKGMKKPKSAAASDAGDFF
jgi:hypothetical protein